MGANNLNSPRALAQNCYACRGKIRSADARSQGGGESGISGNGREETQEMDEGGKKNLIFATNGRKEGRGDLWEAFGGDLCEAKVAAAEGWVARRGICVAAGAIRSEMATGGNGVLKP